MCAIKKNTAALLVTSKGWGVGLEVCMSCERNAEQNHNIKRSNKQLVFGKDIKR